MSISISPASLSGLAGIPPVAFQLLSSGTSVDAAVSPLVITSSTVSLSSAGQLFSALSSFEDDLKALQNGNTDVLSKATVFVRAANRFQSTISNLQVVFDSLSDTTAVNQSLQTLGKAVASAITPESPIVSRLQGIGIEIQTATLPGTNGISLTLSINQNALSAAIQNDSVGTSAVLNQVIQSLLEQTAGIETKIVETSTSLADLSLSGLTAADQTDLSTLLGLNNSSSLPLNTIATDLLQNLPADVVLNNIQLSDLDLAKVGLDAATIESDSNVRRGALAEILLASSNATNAPAEGLLTAIETLMSSDNTLSAPTLGNLPTNTNSATSPATNETPTATSLTLPTANTASVTNQNLTANTATVVVANVDQAQAERSLSTATLALQNLLNDPAIRAINNNRFESAYAAISAAAHLSDFVSPFPDLVRNTPYPDIPAPVVPVAPARGIAYYKETAGKNWH